MGEKKSVIIKITKIIGTDKITKNDVITNNNNN